MSGLLIADKKDGPAGELLAFDLIDVLCAIGVEAERSSWTASGVESIGPASEELHELSDRSARVSGRKLLELASRLDQTIDGVFAAYRPDATDPWVTVRAVDSSFFHVETPDNAVLSALRGQFHDVQDWQ